MSSLNRVKSLENALNIIMKIPENDSISVSNLSKEIGMSKSAVWKILETFCEYGFLSRNDQTKEYSLGPVFISKGIKYLNSLDIKKMVRPYLKNLTDTFNENSMLMIRQGNEALIAEYCEANVPIRLAMQIGQLHALYYGAAPKVLLSYLNHEEQEIIIKNINFKKYTNSTIDSIDKLREAIDKIIQDGFCYSGGEFGSDGIGVAVPLWNGNLQIIGSIAMNVPVFRLESTQLGKMVTAMKRSAISFSTSLGADSKLIEAMIHIEKTFESVS